MAVVCAAVLVAAILCGCQKIQPIRERELIAQEREAAALERIAEALASTGNPGKVAPPVQVREKSRKPTAEQEVKDFLKAVDAANKPGCRDVVYIKGGQVMPEYCR